MIVCVSDRESERKREGICVCVRERESEKQNNENHVLYVQKLR